MFLADAARTGAEAAIIGVVQVADKLFLECGVVEVDTLRQELGMDSLRDGPHELHLAGWRVTIVAILDGLVAL